MTLGFFLPGGARALVCIKLSHGALRADGKWHRGNMLLGRFLFV